jgi:hypothetical protein
MTSRKHYRIAASALATARRKAERLEGDVKGEALAIIDELEANLINLFAGDNPRFSVTLFMQAAK